MGLFRRRDTDSELAAMRAFLDELRAELTERTDNEVQSLRTELEATRADLDERTGSAESSVSSVRAQLTMTSSELDELDARLRAIDDRLSTPMTTPPPPPPTAPPAAPAVPVGTAPAIDSDDVRTLETHLARLDERLAAVDRRVTVVSTELANQLAEISSDIEALDQVAQAAQEAREATDTDTGSDTVPAVDPELLEELRDSQLRLANEQARYQIAFRDDLARLAQQLKRR